MKNLLPVILILALLLGGCGGENHVQTDPTEQTYLYEGPEGVLDEFAPTIIYKCTRVASTDDAGNLNWYREYIYDASGFCTMDTEYTADGQVSHRNVHTPNDAGRTASTTVTQLGGLSYVMTYEYDDQGNLLKQETYMDGQLQETLEYTYDDHGNYLTMKQYYAGALVLDHALTYTYDASGNITALASYTDGMLMFREETTYDDQGRKIATRSTDDQGNLLSRSESTWEGLTETRKEYGPTDQEPYLISVITYDDHGNEILNQSQYTGGDYSMLEFTYEPFEVMK